VRAKSPFEAGSRLSFEEIGSGCSDL